MKLKRGTNNMRGWWFHFADGYECWMLGASAQEIQTLEREHGKLVKQLKA